MAAGRELELADTRELELADTRGIATVYFGYDWNWRLAIFVLLQVRRSEYRTLSDTRKIKSIFTLLLSRRLMPDVDQACE
jgi:hypothetical protein